MLTSLPLTTHDCDAKTELEGFAGWASCGRRAAPARAPRQRTRRLRRPWRPQTSTRPST